MANYQTIEYNKWLCEKYPFLQYNKEDPTYEYTWEDGVENGWRIAFCPQIWEELKAILEKANYVDQFNFAQIKEKYGSLRLYHDGVPATIYDEIHDWERKYEDLSEETCIDCGQPAEWVTTGWVTPLCNDCLQKMRVNGYSKVVYPVKHHPFNIDI